MKKNMLIFLTGFSLALSCYFFIEMNYEKSLYRSIAKNINAENIDSILIQSLKLTHELLKPRIAVFGGTQFRDIKSTIIYPTTFDLMTTHGACGSYARVLARLLMENNINTRFAQMKVLGLYGGHILIEAETKKGWVALDASYNLYFKRQDSALASFDDVKSNWGYFKNKVPAGYDSTYKYDDVRYTNWGKVPVIMPMLKYIIGEKKSIRSYFLRPYKIAFVLSITFFLITTAALTWPQTNKIFKK